MASDGIIRRIVRLVFDKSSGQQTEADAKRALGGVDSALVSLKRTAVNVGTALAAAFGIHAIIAFGKAAVAEAQDSEAAWSELAGTVEATGVSFKSIEKQALATGAAFQQATVHTDEGYARSLANLIRVTGDVRGSMNNMGLVANVAARFFNGDLAPAAELVAKAMNGNVVMLQRMGIHATTAQQALDILAQRSMGAAEERAATFGGRLQQLNNRWGEFKEQLGNALVTNDKARDSLGYVGGIIQNLTTWVTTNQDTLRTWVTTGLQWAVLTVDALYRSVRGFGELLVGSVLASMGIAARGGAALADAFAVAVDAFATWRGAMGHPETMASLFAFTAHVRDQTKALKEWAAAAIATGGGTIGQGARRLATTSQWTQLPTSPGAAPLPGEHNRPAVSAGAGDAAAEAARQQRIKDLWTEADQRAESEQWVRDKEAEFRKNAIEAGWTEAQQRLESQQWVAEQIAKLQEEELKRQQETAAGMAAIVGAAMTGQLKPYAQSKARENVIEATELGIRAFVAALNPFTAVKAAGFAVAAAKHLAIAAAWAGLAGSAGGGGGGSTGTASAGASSSAAAQTASSGAAARTQPQQEVNIYLEGPGFDALNPRVQAVTYGAMQLARERYGAAATVRLHRGTS